MGRSATAERLFLQSWKPRGSVASVVTKDADLELTVLNFMIPPGENPILPDGAEGDLVLTATYGQVQPLWGYCISDGQTNRPQDNMEHSPQSFSHPSITAEDEGIPAI